MITLFDLLIVAAILGFASWGWLVGFTAAIVAALELVACLSVAVMLHEAVAGFLHAGFTLVLGDWVAQAWSILLAFAGLAWGSFAALRLTVHQPIAAAEDEDEETDIDPLADRLAGAVAGGLGGALLVGGGLVTLSMVPFLAGLKPSGDRLLVDVGKTVLRAGAQFARERPEGRCLPLWGEPPSRMAVPSARLASEPWLDVDDDGRFTDADRFRDVDANGTFTKDLYFTDVDGDGLRRVGLIDKYVVGRWDGTLLSEDRPRPDLEKPTPTTPPAASRPTPAPPTAPAKPTEGTPPKAASSEPKREATPQAKPEPVKPDAKPEPAKSERADQKPPAQKPTEPKPPTGKPAKPGESAPPPPTEKLPGDDF